MENEEANLTNIFDHDNSESNCPAPRYQESQFLHEKGFDQNNYSKTEKKLLYGITDSFEM